MSESNPLPNIQTTISPVNQKPVLTRPLLNAAELGTVVGDAVKAQKTWKKVPLEEKMAIVEKWMVEIEKQKDILGEEISEQMGRPISYTPGEIKGALDRVRHLLDITKDCLADITLEKSDKDGFRRWIRREPVGVVGVIAPWNYPYLTMINSVIPGILAGNTIILKPSPQTPTPAERLLSAFLAAGLPKNVIQVVHLPQALVTSTFVTDPRIAFVSFTGSVAGGQAVERAAAEGEGFKGVGLELGGKDPAYVREDCDLKWTAAELVDGAMFNSGQSCCAIERIYVHSSIFDEFVAAAVEVVKGYKLGNPMDKEVNMGPVVSVQSAARIKKQVDEAVAAGAKPLLDESLFPAAQPGTAFVAPQILVDVSHKMEVMMEETFGPIVGVMKVESDDEALQLMNDSPYGLTASIWTDASNPSSIEAFEMFTSELETGTVFLNRCDFLDPALAWTGVKNSGRGVSLSTFGFDQLTRAKSVHMKIKTA